MCLFRECYWFWNFQNSSLHWIHLTFFFSFMVWAAATALVITFMSLWESQVTSITWARCVHYQGWTGEVIEKKKYLAFSVFEKGLTREKWLALCLWAECRDHDHWLVKLLPQEIFQKEKIKSNNFFLLPSEELCINKNYYVRQRITK